MTKIPNASVSFILHSVLGSAKNLNDDIVFWQSNKQDKYKEQK